MVKSFIKPMPPIFASALIVGYTGHGRFRHPSFMRLIPRSRYK
jgi:hypothetical protein